LLVPERENLFQVGALDAVKAPPDGCTLLMDCGGTSSIQEAWSENLPCKVEGMRRQRVRNEQAPAMPRKSPQCARAPG